MPTQRPLSAFDDSKFIYAVFCVSLVYIVCTAYTGLNGSFVWRQADVLSQILGLSDKGQLRGLMNFQGNPSFYDVPIYQYVIARISDVFQSDPLVTARLLNCCIWGAFFFSTIQLSEAIQAKSAKYAALLLGSSPLFLHYFSTPLPDLLAMQLCVTALYLLIFHAGALRGVGFVLFMMAAVIKSPLAFSFIVFYLAYRLSSKQRLSVFDYALCISLLAAAIGAELTRKSFLAGQDYLEASHSKVFAQAPSWYFGTLADRFTPKTLFGIGQSLFVRPFAHGLAGAVFFGGALLVFLRVRRQDSDLNGVFLACLVAAVSGWVVFTNLYVIHDYYQLPTAFFICIFCAVALGNLETGGAFRLLKQYLPMALFAVFIGLLIFGNTLRDPSRDTQFSALR